MKEKKGWNKAAKILCCIGIILICIAVLKIDVDTMMYTARYIDEHGLSPQLLLGSKAAVYLEWVRLLLSPVIMLAAAVYIFRTLWKDL